MTTGTIQTRIVAELRQAGRPLDDDELADRLNIHPRQRVNQACRALAEVGRLRRFVGQGGKLVNELSADAKASTGSAPVVSSEPLAEVAAGDSAAQRRAETVMIDLLGRRLGLVLASRRFDLADGARVEIDGADEEPTVLVEAWAHQGPPKAAQKNKVLADALRLLFLATTLPRTPRLILCLSDPAAAHHFTTARSWSAAALRQFGIDVEIVELPDDVKAAVVAAQQRQYR